MIDEQGIEGVIFNIQHYSIHDGPGIRTTVFLKSCPLRCFWCQNPESQLPQPELFFDFERCAGCGKCVQACPKEAIQLNGGKSETSRDLCDGNGKCAEVCPNEARNMMGRRVTVGEVFKEIKADEIFYKRSGGGVTMSGGEPLSQPIFAAALLQLCREAGIHTVVDTCGYAPWSTVEQVLQFADLVLYDFKHMDSVEHQKYTGVSNELILDNVRKIYHELSIPLLARVPVITGFNDSAANISAVGGFITFELGKSVKVHLLPYHRLGETKFERLEQKDKIVSLEPPSAEHLLELKKILESFGLEVILGG